MSALTDGTGAVTVNVGGTVYMTTLATLTRVEGSMLGALAEALSDDEVLFIDRDGPSFRYVLNYLRDPFAKKPLLPRDPAERDQLAREADFYGLPGVFGRSSTTEAEGGWKGESTCTQTVTQAELIGIKGPRQFPCCDLRSCSLRNMNLTDWNLQGCNLAGVDATGAYFSKTSLAECNLAGVNASHACFHTCSLMAANVSGANLQEAKFIDTNLGYAKFTGANVRRATFKAPLLDEEREQIEREAAPGDYFGPPFGAKPPNLGPGHYPPGHVSRSVGAVFEVRNR